jgi:hypothetical protein
MTPTKRCSTCHEQRPVTDFNVRRAAPDGLQSRCRACSRAWYVANRDQHRANVRRRTVATRIEYKRRIGAHLAAHPCVDCGETDVRVLDFDHDVGSAKRADIAALVAACGRWSDVEAEIAKCSVRCANCHRRVTSERAQDWRSAFAAEQRRAAGQRTGERLRSVLPHA